MQQYFKALKDGLPFTKKDSTLYGFSKEEIEELDDEHKQVHEQLLGANEHQDYYASVVHVSKGGVVDVHLYPQPVGTAIVTRQLVLPKGALVAPNAKGTFELAMYTKHQLPSCSLQKLEDEHPLIKAIHRARTTLTYLARYGKGHPLQEGAAAELQIESVTRYIVLTAPSQYEYELRGNWQHLLVAIEVHGREVKYAKEHGVPELLERLQEKSIGLTSDLDRPMAV